MGAALFNLSRENPAASLYSAINSSRSLVGITVLTSSNMPPQRSSSSFKSPKGPAPRLRKTNLDTGSQRSEL